MGGIKAKPFLKWAGGKGQLLEDLAKRFPQKLIDGKIKRYVEPFLGGGALFFYLIARFDFEGVILNDINKECILTYRVVQNNVEKLIDLLSVMKNKFLSMGEEERKAFYYEQRDIFNDEKIKIDYNNFANEWIGHASRIIFLNRTCFNGLYRQNSKGQFNVPMGSYKNPTICDRDNLIAVSKSLKGVKLLSSDFEALTDYIDENTFVYMDPPYRPLSSTSSFSEYTKEPFNDESQIRLGEWFRRLSKEKRAYLMLSNSDPTNTDPDDKFFDELYDGFKIERIKAVRAINSKSNGRGAIRELLITNYKWGDYMGTGNEFAYMKSDSTFQYLLDTLRDSIKGWYYFVNWEKVKCNVRKVEIQLNLLNYIIGKEDIEKEFRYLVKSHPDILGVIPVLIACRDKKFEIMHLTDDSKINLERFDFTKKKTLTDTDIDKVVNFAKNSGIFDLFKNRTIKNFVDYVFGVEVGLDTNGRKNRTGTAMENLVEMFIEKVCKKYNYSYIAQATPTRIKTEWDYDVTVDKSERRFDFAIDTGKKLFLIETNFYSGGGSKLKATAGEYKTLFDVLSNDGHEFIWITDGIGWHTASRPLQETFNHINYLLNLKMVESGVLEKILTENI